jgi:hypothetical protein
MPQIANPPSRVQSPSAAPSTHTKRWRPRKDDYTIAVERVLNASGVSDWAYERTRGGHRRLIFNHRGQQRAMTFPLTGSDWRGSLETAARLRRLIRAMEGRA